MRASRKSLPSTWEKQDIARRAIDAREALAPYLAFVLALLYALPTVGAIIPVVQDAAGVGSLETLLVFALSIIICAGLILHTKAGIMAVPKALVVCYTICFGIFTLKYLVYFASSAPLREGFHMWRERTLGFIFAAAVCACIALMTNAVARRRMLDLLSHALAFVFLLQVFISLFQARTGIILERQEAEIVTSFESLLTRDLLGQTDWGIQSFGLFYPVTGLLGQFNRFGVVCVFFNLLFLAQIAIKWRWSYLLLAGVALVASILNTTKTAVITIIITDVLFFCINRRVTIWLRSLVFLGFAIGSLIYGIAMINSFLYQNSGQLSLSIRGTMWTELWRLYKVYGLDSILHVLFGLDFTFFLTQGVSRSGSMLSLGSYENEAFLLIFNFGMLGFAGFCYAFYVDAFHLLKKVPNEMRWVYRLLPLNILLCSITMDCQTKWYTLPIITIVILLCVARQDGQASTNDLGGGRTPHGRQ